MIITMTTSNLYHKKLNACVIFVVLLDIYYQKSDQFMSS